MSSDSEDDNRQALRNKRKARQNESDEDELEEVKVISSNSKEFKITQTAQEPTLELDQISKPIENNEKIEINQKNLSLEKKSRFNNHKQDEDNDDDKDSYVSQSQAKKSFGFDNEEVRSQIREGQEPVQRKIDKDVLENENSFFTKKNK